MDLLEPADVIDMADDAVGPVFLSRLFDEVPLESGGGMLDRMLLICLSSDISAAKEESLIPMAILELTSPKEGLLVKPEEDMKELVMSLTCEPLPFGLPAWAARSCEKRKELPASA